VPTPKREIVDPDIGYVGNNLLAVSDSILVGAQFPGITSGETDFADRSEPRRTVAECLDLISAKFPLLGSCFEYVMRPS